MCVCVCFTKERDGERGKHSRWGDSREGGSELAGSDGEAERKSGLARENVGKQAASERWMDRREEETEGGRGEGKRDD